MTANCRYCGLWFDHPEQFGKVIYCSSRCRVLHRPPLESWEYKGCSSQGYYGSKRRRQKMQSGDCIDYLVIYEYYDWECHLCGENIDRDLTSPDPMCATIDHIVPLSQGGLHEWTNLAPAHLSCNQGKDSRLDTEASDGVD